MPVDPNFIPTWEQDVPHRPGTDDLINGVKENQPPQEAVPATMPAAEEDMQKTAQIVALGMIVPLLVVTVTFPGGTPTVAGFKSTRTDLAPTDITLTNNGSGDTTVSIASAKVPSFAGIAPSGLTLNFPVAAGAKYAIGAVNFTGTVSTVPSVGARVTTSSNAIMSALPFTVCIG